MLGGGLRPPGGRGGRAGATTGRTAGWPPRCSPAGAPGCRCSTRPAPGRLPACDLVIDAAYGTGFRGTYEAPDVPARGAGAGRRHPLGGRRRHRRGRRAGPCAADADRDLRRARSPGSSRATAPAGRPGRGGRHRRAASGGPAIALVEDADLAGVLPRRRAAGAHKWASAVAVVAGSPGMEGAAAALGARGLARGAGHGAPGRARGRARPTGRSSPGPGPSRRCVWRSGPTGGLAPCSTSSTGAGRWSSAPGSAATRPPAAADPPGGGPSRRCRWWPTPTRSYALGDARRGRAGW